MKEIVELISNHGVSIIIVGLFIMDYLNNKNKTTQVIERIDRTTEKVGETLEELKEAIEDYIYYYNNKRIKEKLKGLTPASYRSQSLLVS